MARRQGDDCLKVLLGERLVDRPAAWVVAVNQTSSAKEQQKIRTCLARNRPFGTETWQTGPANRLGLTASLRPEGRPTRAESHDVTQNDRLRAGLRP